MCEPLLYSVRNVHHTNIPIISGPIREPGLRSRILYVPNDHCNDLSCHMHTYSHLGLLVMIGGYPFGQWIHVPLPHPHSFPPKIVNNLAWYELGYLNLHDIFSQTDQYIIKTSWLYTVIHTCVVYVVSRSYLHSSSTQWWTKSE